MNTVISSDLTQGMSLIEKLVVLLCAHASKTELRRIRTFLNHYAKIANRFGRRIQ